MQWPIQRNDWLWGKLSSIIVSKTINISILPLNLFFSNSNLFLMEFMFKWANIKLLTLPLRIGFRVLSQKLSCSASNNTSELHSSKFRLELVLNSQLKTLEISLIKVLLETSSRIILAYVNFLKFTSAKMMRLDFLGMVNKICFFLYTFLLRCYSLNTLFSLKFALSVLSIIFDMLTSCWSFSVTLQGWL